MPSKLPLLVGLPDASTSVTRKPLVLQTVEPGHGLETVARVAVADTSASAIIVNTPTIPRAISNLTFASPKSRAQNFRVKLEGRSRTCNREIHISQCECQHITIRIVCCASWHVVSGDVAGEVAGRLRRGTVGGPVAQDVAAR